MTSCNWKDYWKKRQVREKYNSYVFLRSKFKKLNVRELNKFKEDWFDDPYEKRSWIFHADLYTFLINNTVELLDNLDKIDHDYPVVSFLENPDIAGSSKEWFKMLMIMKLYRKQVLQFERTTIDTIRYFYRGYAERHNSMGGPLRYRGRRKAKIEQFYLLIHDIRRFILDLDLIDKGVLFLD